MAKKKKPLEAQGLKSAVLQVIAAQGRPVSKREIARHLRLKGSSVRIELKATLNDLMISGDVRRERNQYVLATSASELHEGQIIPILIDHPDEEGRLLGKVGETEVYLRPKAHHRHFDPGLHILGKIIGKEDGLWHAEIIRYIERPLKTHLGQIEYQPRGAVLKPLGKTPFAPIRIDKATLERCQDGAIVTYTYHQGELKIMEVLGFKNDPQIFSLFAIQTYQLPHIFPEQALEEAEKGKVPPLGKRKDLREIPFVTIDGEDARDFDDAVWAEPDTNSENEGGWRLWIAIADVSYYVRAGSVLDHEAQRRGNSVYFPDRVVPMLPEALSNELCSLKPNVDRACLAVEVVINARGKMKSHQFYRGLMRSRARLTYEQIQKAYDGTPDEVTQPLMENVIRPLYEAYDCIFRERVHRGTLELNVPERQVVFDNKGQLKALVLRERLDSHRLIEEFMIAANVAAAKALGMKDHPCVYRIHDAPDRLRVANLRTVLKKMKVPFAPASVPSPHQFNELLRKTEDSPLERMVHELVLRSQAQARYSPVNIGHYGLNLRQYCHFTSPIRRYADLVVHRSLIHSLSLACEPYEIPKTPPNLHKISEHISETERTAANAEREVFKRYSAAYLASLPERVFEAIITGVIRNGIFAEVAIAGAEGFIPRSILPQGLTFDTANNRFTNRKGNFSLALGQRIRVEVTQIEPLGPLVRMRLV